MFLKIAVFSFLLWSSACLGQSCSANNAVTTIQALVGMSCTPVQVPYGNEVYSPNLSGAMTSQTICDTTTTAPIPPATDATYCPAGLLRVDVNVEPVVLGTLVSTTSVSITYTSDVRTYTNLAMASCTAISLTSASPASCFSTFYHAVGTTVSIATTVASLTGSPTYTVRGRSALIGNQ